MSNIENEIEWLKTIAMPVMLKNGKLVADYDEVNAKSFRLRDIEIKLIGPEEAFMLTSCYRATLKFEYVGVEHTKKLVVKKTPPLPVEVYDAINFGALFQNEINFYTQMIPRIEEFIGSAFNAPQFLYGEKQRAFAAVILEDFSVNNWCVCKDKINVSLEHTLQAVKYLGNFHAIGYALKQRDPVLFQQLTAELRESRFASGERHPEWELARKYGVHRVVKATASYYPEIDGAFFKLLKDMTEDQHMYGKQLVVPHEPLATLCHGDYMRNNVAFKYDETGEPIGVMMFDMQTMRLSSPMVDLAVFLAVSTFAAVRDENFEQIFDLYCGELASTYVKLTGSTVPDFLSRDTLLKEYIRFLPYSLGITGCFLMALVDPEEISIDERLTQERTHDEIRMDAMTRGGERVDRELAAQCKVLHDLSIQYNVNISKGIGFEVSE